jgi:radical SAM superfamily enzyme YgiQ (UPF0313 family)
MYKDHKYRVFQYKRVVDEMEEVKNRYQAREVYFDDDTFTANKRQVLTICNEIRRRRVNLLWSCMGDAMVVDEEMIEAMADAGCIGMKFGVESGDERILKYIHKPIDFQRIKQVALWYAQRRIKTHATFTFGLLGDTKESMRKTMELAKELDVDSVQFSIVTPFPGTEYYKEVKGRGSLLSQDWERFDGSCSCVVKFDNLSSEEVVEFCKKASSWWLHSKIKKPKWLLRQLYNLNRSRRGQGFGVLISRCLRAMELIGGR